MGKLITDSYETTLEDNKHLYLKRNQLREALSNSPLGKKKLKR
jgi:regulator of replication initiation timing